MSACEGGRDARREGEDGRGRQGGGRRSKRDSKWMINRTKEEEEEEEEYERKDAAEGEKGGKDVER